MLRRIVLAMPVWIALSACTSTTTTPQSMPSVKSSAAIPLPLNVRPDLDRKWTDASGQIKWPPADGFAGPPILVVLPPGTLLDRFGSDNGRFFSPKGAAYGARALPYLCEKLPYVPYRVQLPLQVWAGKAAPWFDEVGGATQFQTDAPAAALKADHAIVPVAMPPQTAAPC